MGIFSRREAAVVKQEASEMLPWGHQVHSFPQMEHKHHGKVSFVAGLVNVLIKT